MSPIVLPSKCDRATAASLHGEWKDCSGAEPIILDGHAVETMSHAMLQLLVSAAKTGAGLEIQNSSEPLQAAMRLAGLEDHLLESETP